MKYLCVSEYDRHCNGVADTVEDAYNLIKDECDIDDVIFFELNESNKFKCNLQIKCKLQIVKTEALVKVKGK